MNESYVVINDLAISYRLYYRHIASSATFYVCATGRSSFPSIVAL